MKNKRLILRMGSFLLLWIFSMDYSPAAAQTKQELKIVMSAWGNETLNPFSEMGKGMDYMKLLYDPVFGSTPEGRLSPEYGIAEKWEMSPDGLLWTIHIRKGVKFHDGVEMTARDVKFSMDESMKPESKLQYAGARRLVVKAIEVKNPYMLQVQCKKPSLFMPGLFSDVSGSGYLVIPKDYYERVGKDKFTKNPVGSGPYKFRSHVHGSEIKLEAAGRHWRDGMPRYPWVTFRLIPEETTRVAMIRTGEADLTHVSRRSATELQKEGFPVISKKDAAVVEFHCNMQWATPAFSDLRFRKALNLAIDKTAIIKHLFMGFAQPIGTYPGPNIEGCGGRDLEPYAYDPEEARRLIKEGGYPGFEFAVPSYPREGCSEFQEVVEAVCGYWEKVGLKPKIFNTDYSSWRDKMMSGNSSGTVSGSNWTATPTCGENLTAYSVKFQSTMKGAYAKSPQLDQMIDKASSSVDEAEMEKLVRDLYRYIYDQHLWVPICSINEEMATARHVPKWNPGRRRDDRNFNDIIRQR